MRNRKISSYFIRKDGRVGLVLNILEVKEPLDIFSKLYNFLYDLSLNSVYRIVLDECENFLIKIGLYKVKFKLLHLLYIDNTKEWIKINNKGKVIKSGSSLVW